MRKLSVFIEINGISEYVGEITGTDGNEYQWNLQYQ